MSTNDLFRSDHSAQCLLLQAKYGITNWIISYSYTIIPRIAGYGNKSDGSMKKGGLLADRFALIGFGFKRNF